MLVFGGVLFDLKTFKIPNKFNLFGIILGLNCSFFSGHLLGLKYAAIGLVIPFFMLFALFAFKIIGAGDIKFLCAIGTFVGIAIVKVVLVTMLFTAIIGAAVVCYNVTRIGYKKKKRFTKIHLSVPIAISTMLLVWGGI